MTGTDGPDAAAAEKGLKVAQAPPLPDPGAAREPNALLFSSLFLGVLFDLLFYGKALGISYPLFIAAFYIHFFLHARGSGRERPLCGFLLFIPVIALASTFALYSNSFLLALNFLAVPVLLTVHTVLTAGANRFPWFDARFAADLLEGLLVRPFTGFFVPFRMGRKVLKERAGRKRYEVIKKVATGLAVSLPLLLVVVLLLSSADAVFSHYLARLPELIGKVKLGEAIFRTVLALLVLLISFAYIYSFSPKGRVPKTAPAAPLELKRPWDPVTVSTFLSVLNLVYIFFVAIQFSYLFGGGRLALPEGFTYAEYARQGFFELLAVTVINFCVFILIINFTNSEKRPSYNAVRALLTLMASSTLVMLVSAFFRLSLYEEAYGFTYARVTAHAFMIYLLALFLIAIARIWKERISLLKAFTVITVAAYLVFNFAGIDRFIASRNIDRYFRTGKIDAHYLTRLSDDAVPELIRLMDVEDENVSSVIKGALDFRKERLVPQKWQSFNRSRQKAGSLLRGLNLQPSP